MAVSFLKTTFVEQQCRDLLTLLPKEKQEAVYAAYLFSSKRHKGQIRKTGEPYIVHPHGVAVRLAKGYQDTALIIAGFLHDIVEDCPETTIATIYELFGSEVGFLVDAVTKNATTFHVFPDVEMSDHIERLLWAGIQDIRVLILKIADRENNLETIRNLKKTKQVRMAFETQAIYQPLKKILGYMDPAVSIDNAAQRLQQHMMRSGIKTAQELKDALVNQSFINIDHDLFGLVYKDSESIVWKITNRQTYQRICENDLLRNMIRFLTVEGNKQWFCATFQFIQGAVIPGNIKIGISSYRS